MLSCALIHNIDQPPNFTSIVYTHTLLDVCLLGNYAISCKVPVLWWCTELKQLVTSVCIHNHIWCQSHLQWCHAWTFWCQALVLAVDCTVSNFCALPSKLTCALCTNHMVSSLAYWLTMTTARKTSLKSRFEVQASSSSSTRPTSEASTGTPKFGDWIKFWYH